MRIKRLNHRKNQRGDTIVEVLIAVGIVSLILTSSYMLTSRNTRTMQNIREQTQAQKLVERQIEFLRGTSNLAGFKSNTNKCFDSNGAASTSTASCTLNVNGAQAGANDGARYAVLVTYDPSKTVYTVSATWDKLGGSKANITTYYYYDQ